MIQRACNENNKHEMIQRACNENNKHECEVQKIPRGGASSEATRCFVITWHRQSSLFNVADQNRCRAGVRCVEATPGSRRCSHSQRAVMPMRSPKTWSPSTQCSFEKVGVSEACSSSKSVRPNLLERRCYGCSYGCNRSVETGACSISKL